MSCGWFGWGLLTGFLCGASACAGFGFLSTRYHPIEESKLCYEALRDDNGMLQAQTREYLKARLYWNADVWVLRSWMADWDIDFGPVDESVLKGIKAFKDGSDADSVYKRVRLKYSF